MQYFWGANVCAVFLLLLLLLEKKKIEQKLTNKWSFFAGERLLFYPSSIVQGIVAYIFFPAMSVLPMTLFCSYASFDCGTGTELLGCFGASRKIEVDIGATSSPNFTSFVRSVSMMGGSSSLIHFYLTLFVYVGDGFFRFLAWNRFANGMGKE